jgi:type II secretory pathway component PulF
MTASSAKPAITLDQLIALNAEIAALVRAGVPLDRGLSALGEDLPGRLGRFAQQLGDDIARGQSLTDALAAPSAKLPPIYCAVVQAGIASGRLPTALESLAGSLRRLAETRRGVMLSLIYPVILFLLVWGLFAAASSRLSPAVYYTFQQQHRPGEDGLPPGEGAYGSSKTWGLLTRAAIWTAAAIAHLGESAGIWGPLGPVVVLGLLVLWWLASRAAAVARPDSATWVFGWIPGMGRMLRLSRTAVFVEVLKLLVENRLPLDQAITLAAETAGDARLIRAARSFAESARRGEPGPPNGLPGLPPVLNWLIAGGQRNNALLPALRHAADDYLRRAERQAELSRTMLPVFISGVISGLIVIAYALGLLAPYFVMLGSMSL